jgi:hypothetical protein
MVGVETVVVGEVVVGETYDVGVPDNIDGV